jgi:hypothetical protein
VFSAIPGCCILDSDCNDGDLCTIDVCDTVTGACSVSDKCAGPILGCGYEFCSQQGTGACVVVANGCDDGNGCSADRCNTVSQLCENVAGPTCSACNVNSDCVDSDPCTFDYCNNFYCVHIREPGC